MPRPRSRGWQQPWRQPLHLPQVQSTALGADIELIFAQVLAGVLNVESVETDKHFFDELGADSMTMARFCARLRKREDVPNVSMKDVYANPTLKRLASMGAAANASAPESSQPRRRPDEAEKPITNREVALCGLMQFAVSLVYTYLIALFAIYGYHWIVDGGGYVEIFQRSASSRAAVLFSFQFFQSWRNGGLSVVGPPHSSVFGAPDMSAFGSLNS